MSNLMEQQRQGSASRKLAAWASIVAVPTALSGIFGMNFIRMPGTDVEYGYRGAGSDGRGVRSTFVRFKRLDGSDMLPHSRPKVGLAPGSGSARGWSHIGVIRALQAAGYKPDIICGTSIGAWSGLCMRQATDWLEARVRKLDWQGILTLMDFNISGGLLEGRRLVDFFRQRFNDEGIEKLSMPFACVATELQTGREVWLNEGSVIDAVRASIALPVCSRLLSTKVTCWSMVARESGSGFTMPRHGRRCSDCRGLELGPDWPARQRIAIAPQRVDGPACRTASQDGFFGGWFAGERSVSPTVVRTDQTVNRSMLSVLTTSLNIMQVRITQSRTAGDPADVVIRPRLAGLVPWTSTTQP